MSVSDTVDIVNTVQHFQVLRQNVSSLLAGFCVSITRMCRGAHMNSIREWHGERKLLNKVIFVFYTEKVFSSLHTIKVEPLVVTWAILTMSLLSFWALKFAITLQSLGWKALGFHQKYLNLCSEDERRSYGFGTTWGWVINDRNFIFGWTNPLRTI